MKEKRAFGVYQDGLNIKVAQLILSNGIIKVESLDETILSSPLFREEEEIKDEVLPILPEVKDEEFTDLEDLDDETFELPDLSDIDQSEDIEQLDENADEVLPGQRELQNFLQIFPLDRGKISFSANDEQITYFKFDQDFAKTGLKKKLMKEMLTPKEIKSRSFTLGYVQNQNKSGLAFTHRGRFQLFHALRDINLVLSKERYFYSYIDPNEISLMNLVRHNYEFPSDEFVLLLYIGIDYKVGIVMRDGMHIKTFPIIVPEADYETTRQAIYSKVILEQDVSDMAITKNVILIGDHVSDSDIDFFNSKAMEGDLIQRLTLEKLIVQEGVGTQITEENIARFAIPIALAWKTLDPKNKNFYHCNLLPPKVIENQKYFKIAWHGYLVLAGIFFMAYNGTVSNLVIKHDIVGFQKSNASLEVELSRNKGMIAKLNEIKTRLTELESNFEKVELLSGNKNLWYYILNIFSETLSANPISWLGDIASSDTGFEISGFTTSRRSIITFSDLFPDGDISSIMKYEIEDLTIWGFAISYTFPEARLIKQQDSPATQLSQEISPTEELEPEVIVEPKVEPKMVPKDDTITFISEDQLLQEALSDTEDTTVRPIVPDEMITRDYRHILDVYFAGDYQSAIRLFDEFQQDYDYHNLSYDALYYQGECYFLLNEYQNAQRVFTQVYDKGKHKSPDALLMLGNTWEKLENFEMAKENWIRVIDEFPSDELAVSARYKIEKMSGN
jgi:TolA-binding protein